VLTSGLSSLLLGVERVGGLQPRQEREGKEREGNEGKRKHTKREEEEEGGILLCLLLASLRFFLARKESEASSLVRRLLRLFISAEQPLINSS
jgi:hypothetical protein